MAIHTGPERAPWDGFPPVVRNAELHSLDREPEYTAAKAGDREAALALVDRVLTQEAVEAVRARLDGIGDVRILPVMAEEATGRNKIPLMMAEVLGHRLGVDVEYGITQDSNVRRTGSSSDHRLAFSPVFHGDVAPGRAYFLVDDTLSMGGTVAALRGFLLNRGALVAGAAVMTAHEGALNLPVTDALLQKIDAKHGPAMNQFWKEEFGHDINQLTQAEAGHLRAAASVDALRERISSARNAAGRGMGQAEVGREDPEGSPVTLAPLTGYRDSQISRATHAYEQAKEAFWATGDTLPEIKRRIETESALDGPSAAALIETISLRTAGTPYASRLEKLFAKEVAEAVRESPDAQVREKTLKHAAKHLNRQIRRASSQDNPLLPSNNNDVEP